MTASQLKSVAMVLLAGGHSSRMGTDKARLRWEGVPFWRKIAGELAAFGPVHISVASEQDAGRYLPWPIIADRIPDAGPMGGICSAFQTLPADSLFVCACDMPRMNREYVRYLLEQWETVCQQDQDAQGLMVRSADGSVYATAGIYARSLLPAMESLLAQNIVQLQTLFDQSRIVFLEEEALPPEVSAALMSVNTPEDCRSLEAVSGF